LQVASDVQTSRDRPNIIKLCFLGAVNFDVRLLMSEKQVECTQIAHVGSI
jgi:hypothetical protein